MSKEDVRRDPAPAAPPDIESLGVAADGGGLHVRRRRWRRIALWVTSGRLAELFGASMVPTDAFLRALGLRRVAEQEWRLISPRTRSYLRAYADVVNAWIADHGGSSASGAKGLEYGFSAFRTRTTSWTTGTRWTPSSGPGRWRGTCGGS